MPGHGVSSVGIGAAALLGFLLVSHRSSHVIYESRLELARLPFADFDPSVSRIVAQPFPTTAHVDGAGRRHIPDFLLMTESGPLAVDVKPTRGVALPQ